MNRKAAAIVNVHAAAGLARYRWPRTARMLAERLGDVEVRFTQKPGDAIGLAEELASAGFDPIVAAGGDGTLNEVANGLLAANTGASMGILPIASGGDFARTLGLGRMRQAVETLAAGYVRKIDVMRAGFQGPNGPAVRYFVNIASAGLGGLVAQEVCNKWRFLPGTLRYMSAVLPLLAAGCVFRVRLCLDGQDAGCFDATIASLANGRYQGGGIQIAPAAVIDDGLIHITVVEQVSLAEVLRHLPLLYNGAIYTYPKVHHWEARRVRMDGPDAAPLELDGEPLGTLPLEAEVVPQVLPIICPAPAC